MADAIDIHITVVDADDHIAADCSLSSGSIWWVDGMTGATLQPAGVDEPPSHRDTKQATVVQLLRDLADKIEAEPADETV